MGGCLCPLSGTPVALHTTLSLGVSAEFATQNPGASAEFSAAKFITAKLSKHEAPPPPCTEALCKPPPPL